LAGEPEVIKIIDVFRYAMDRFPGAKVPRQPTGGEGQIERWVRLPANPLQRHFGRARVRGCEELRRGFGKVQKTG
jgi:hypothetical protein